MVNELTLNLPPTNGNGVESTPASASNIDMEHFHITTPQEEMQVDSTSSNPVWNFTEETNIFEVARWHSCKNENYLRGCMFSPDGTCLLTVVNLDGVQVFEIPLDLYEKNGINDTRVVSKLTPAVHVKEGQNTTVYDMAWYPQMNSHLPETCW